MDTQHTAHERETPCETSPRETSPRETRPLVNPHVLFPFYLDGPGGECFGAAPAEHDAEAVVRLVALALPLRVERDGCLADADGAGHEGFVSVETLCSAYLGLPRWPDVLPPPALARPERAASWSIRAGAPLSPRLSPSERFVAEALSRLVSAPATAEPEAVQTSRVR